MKYKRAILFIMALSYVGPVGGHVGSNPTGWPNMHMKAVFQVRSIVQKPKGK